MPFKRISIPRMGASVSPLNITCTATSCSDNLHCFKLTKKQIEEGTDGQCRDCDIEIVDWERIHSRDLTDTDYTFKMLNHELIRNVFCLSELDLRVYNYALRKGRIELRKRALKELETKVGKAQNYREGVQTPKTGNNIIHYAMHGTASCCRKCMEYWHGISVGHDLTEEEYRYLLELIMIFIEERMCDMNFSDKPQKVTPVRRQKLITE